MKAKTIEVDVAAIVRLEHRCTGCPASECCCAKYELCLDESEVENVAGFVAEAVRLCPHLKSDEALDNVFEEIGSGLVAVETNEDGLCVFGYRKGGALLCSLHTAAERMGVPVVDVKPRSCLLWPLALSEGRNPALVVQGDAYEFGCNTRRRGRPRTLCPSVADIVETVFGQAFRAQLEYAVAAGSARVRLAVGN